jgi:16S rRNA (cytosine1402-N4)-methyltransferase
MALHIPVMLEECLTYFEDQSIKVFFDGTLGAGGHAKALLAAHPEIEMYIGCDRDKSALEIARETLKPWEDKVVLVHGNFADLDQHLQELGIEEVDGFFLT